VKIERGEKRMKDETKRVLLTVLMVISFFLFLQQLFL